MSSVMRGRMSNGYGWEARWRLFNDLKGRHTELGQEIDFSHLHAEVERVFLFDLVSPAASSVHQSVDVAKVEAAKSASSRFGSPISDVAGYSDFHERLRGITTPTDGLFERAKTENIARVVLGAAKNAAERLKREFNVEIAFKDGVLDRLATVARIYEQRLVVITPELIAWADDHSAFRGR